MSGRLPKSLDAEGKDDQTAGCLAMPNRNQKIRENVVSPNGMSPESTVPQKLNSMCKRIE